MKQFEVKLPSGELMSGLSGQDVVALAKSGRLTGDSMIRQQGQEGWRLVKSVPQIAAHIATSPPDPPLPIPAAEAAIPTPAVVPIPKRFSRSMFIGVGAALVVALLAVAGAAAWYLFVPGSVSNWADVLDVDPDPEVVRSESLRSAIRATGYPWRVRDKGTGIELVLIPPGTFEMGCSASSRYACESDENPVHTVTLTNAFYMGRYEVTQAQWTAKMGFNPSVFTFPVGRRVSAEEVPSRPVERVSWEMVHEFLGSTGMRLPTEAEWEYACRAGTRTAFHSTKSKPNGFEEDADLQYIAQSNDRSGMGGNAGLCTHPVGGLIRNGYGLHDMLGNVAEWVNDWYSASYYSSGLSVNPPGPSSGSKRVVRGGSWFSDSKLCRASARSYATPSLAEDLDIGIVGFRVARNP